MNHDELTEILERAAAPVPRPDLAAGALLEARRVRRRRAGTGVVIAASMTVVAVVLGSALLGGSRATEPAPRPSQGKLPLTQSEAIPEDVVQDFWDVSAARSLPLRATVLPETIEPPSSAPDLAASPLPAAVLALWGEDDRTYLLSPDGDWRAVAHPGPDPSQAVLSDDGTRLAQTADEGLVVWTLRRGTSTTLPWPDGLRLPVSDFVSALRWTPDGEHLLVVSNRQSWLLGLSGRAEALPVPSNRYSGEVYPTEGGRVLEFAYDLPGTFGRELREWDGDSRVSALDSTPLESLNRGAVRGDLFAAVRGDGGWSAPRLSSDWDGLIVFGRDDLTARAYLPIRDDTAAYSQGALTVHGWLDDETVLVWVRPKADPRQVGEDWWLVTWHHPTGELTRVAGGDGYARLIDVVPALVQ